MGITFESRGEFENINAWLKKAMSNNVDGELNRMADSGTRSLAARTPMVTGATAAGWRSKITRKGDVTEIAWMNDAHPEESVNIAKLIELGHGTGTGGYVPPRPYIKNAMSPIWAQTDQIVRGMIK